MNIPLYFIVESEEGVIVFKNDGKNYVSNNETLFIVEAVKLMNDSPKEFLKFLDILNNVTSPKGTKIVPIQDMQSLKQYLGDKFQDLI